MEALRRIERELERQGYLQQRRRQAGADPEGGAPAGRTALRRVFAELPRAAARRARRARRRAAGEITGASRRWQFGDEQPIDVVRTVRNAVLRARARRRGAGRGRVRLAAEDFEVVETERRTAAAVCLLVDMSYSMALRGTWGVAKPTALALHALVRSQVPAGRDPDHRVLRLRREMRETDSPASAGTGPGHQPAARADAGRAVTSTARPSQPGRAGHHRRRADRAPAPGRQFWFDWPPSPETLELTLAEVDKMTRRGATMNVFMLADDERLTAFVEEVARRNGGRVLRAMPEEPGRVRGQGLHARPPRADRGEEHLLRSRPPLSLPNIRRSVHGLSNRCFAKI